MTASPCTVALRYLDLHGVPTEGGAFLNLHAPDAWLLWRGKPAKRRDVACDEFTEGFHDACTHWLQSGSDAVASSPRLGEPEWHSGDGRRGIVRIAFQQTTTQTPYWVQWGVELLDEVYQILWVVLSLEDRLLTFDLGHALAVSELAFVPSQESLPARCWLDVAYRRQFHFARPTLQMLQDQKFSCHGTGSCCQIYWEVTAPPEAQVLIDALPWESLGAPHLVGHQLEVKSDDTLYVKKGGARCDFLDENTRCRIHAAIGTPFFAACVTFPFRFAEAHHGVAVSTSYHCGSASQNFGLPLESRREDIWRRLNQVGLMTSPVKGYVLSPGQVVDGDRYSAVESRLLEALADETLPMFQRLWVAARTLEAEVHGAMVRTEDYRVECVPEMTAAEQILAEAYAPFWLGCLAKLLPELKPLATLRPRAKEPRDPARASRWLRSTLLSKDLAYQFDLTVAMTALVILYLALLSFESQSDSLPDESYWYVLGTISNHNKLGEMFRLVFESAENFRTEMGDPLAPVMFLAWLAQTTHACETP